MNPVFGGGLFGHLTDFIIPFEHYVAGVDDDENETRYDAFLKGMVKGIWTIYNFLEAELVQDKVERKR